MLKFHNATVTEKTQETDDSVLLSLSVPQDAAGEFQYSQGQHLVVRADVNGEVMRRTYSICSSVEEKRLRIGVRTQGKFSGYVADKLAVGDTIEVMPPTGHFQTPLDASNKKIYVAFVAGSGITPILSILKTTLETENDSRFIVFYGNRKRSSTMFVEQLLGLKNLYAERLSLHFILSQEEGEIPVYNGRVDGTKVNILQQNFLKDIAIDDFFICGPNPMIDDVRDSLIELGYKKEQIHSERFRAEEEAASATEENPATRDRPGDKGTRVTVIMDGNQQSFEMRSNEQTLLDAAQENGLDLPYSCMGGVCSTCRTLLSKGKVNMAANFALEDWELEEGFILACQARPESDEIEIDYDQA
ncbi:MAG: 2Fe-2S iron-sulfur cluster binding domain-containing protein [Gammaproteobacteria bacterium]|nr:2Fe-2S iron-sulfur cluster binding domain-containing protein [Gammaproteobacteria bacterium]